MGQEILLVANTDWYLFNFRLSLAQAIRAHGWEPVLASPSGPYRRHIEGAGFRYLPLSMNRRGVLPHQELRDMLRMLSTYRSVRPSLIHHHTLKPVLYGTLAARNLGIPAVVNSITGLGFVFLSGRLSAKLIRMLAIPACRLVLKHPRVHLIFENQGDQAFFINRGMARLERSSLIEGVGVDLSRYQASEEPSGPPLVLMAARILWDKGVQEFVEAARLLKGRSTPGRFVLVGAPDTGNPSSIPLQQIHDWVGQGHIEWWGHRNDMPQVYQACHVVALPSHFEGVPTVLLEASASGRPIVATDIPGNREIVEHGQNGVLVPVSDAQAFADALEGLLRDAELRRSMGVRGRAMVEERFSQDEINRRTIQIYDRLLRG